MGKINRAAAGKGRVATENIGVGAAVSNIVVSLIGDKVDPFVAVNIGVLVVAAVAWLGSIARDKGFPGFEVK